MCGTWIFRVVALVLAGAVCPGQPARVVWPDTYVGRLQALAVLQSFNAEVLASRSATVTLENWCRVHRLAATPVIVARLAVGLEKAPAAEQLARLRVSGPGEVKYRRVELRCGERLLSVADNWYVPGRLTAEMNNALETTDRPFGRVVQALGVTRQTLAMRVLWMPLPEGWEMGPAVAGAGGTLEIPEAVLEHRAILTTKEGLPFSEVRETYQRDLFSFGAPR